MSFHLLRVHQLGQSGHERPKFKIHNLRSFQRFSFGGSMLKKVGIQLHKYFFIEMQKKIFTYLYANIYICVCKNRVV